MGARVWHIGATLLCIALTGCLGNGDDVASTSSSVRTSMVPASVPYYVDLCGPEADKSYRLFAPSKLKGWLDAEDVTDGHDKVAQARGNCALRRKIANGSPITVRLHRVGIGGLAKFNPAGQCKKHCRRDIAIVLDFNGAKALQKPIVAFYQTDVPPEGNLQFLNQVIFSQNEWFYLYPPSVRVRLYDVRDDKDAALRANLEAIKKGASFISSYISGAAAAGPIVDTAVQVADQLISGKHNRAILDMSFQLFPNEQQKVEPDNTTSEKSSSEVSSAQLSDAEVKALQRELGSGLKIDGKPGAKTQAALRVKIPDLGTLPVDTPAFNKAVRQHLVAVVSKQNPQAQDATFATPVYASQFIVFDEAARTRPCVPPVSNSDDPQPRERLSKLESSQRRRNLAGMPLPDYRFVPDGLRYGGARVYSINENSTAFCLLETAYVIFEITKDSTNVAADVAKRISDLQAKFAPSQAVSEDAVASLNAARVDAELALAIDRLENVRGADQLQSMLRKLGNLVNEAKVATIPDRPLSPLPSTPFRYRAFRLTKDYLDCSLSDLITGDQILTLANALTDEAWQGVIREEGAPTPYFGKEAHTLKLACPVTEPDQPADDKDKQPSAAAPAADTAPEGGTPIG